LQMVHDVFSLYILQQEHKQKMFMAAPHK
jgi:hypothetical protein